MVQRLHQARERVAARVRRGEKGFTLIELLIVIVILGVLAGIVVFAVGAFNDRGHEAACKTDLKNVEIAAEAHLAQTGAYPAGDTSAARLEALRVAGYIKETPNSPNYTITLNADGSVAGDLTGGDASTNCSA